MALPFTVTLFEPVTSGEHDPFAVGGTGLLPPVTPLLEPLLAWFPELPELLPLDEPDPPLVPEPLPEELEPLLPDPPFEPELGDPLEPLDPPEPDELAPGDPLLPLLEGSPKPPPVDVELPPQAAKKPIAKSPSSRRIARLLRARPRHGRALRQRELKRVAAQRANR
jgi:hypothetical protein